MVCKGLHPNSLTEAQPEVSGLALSGLWRGQSLFVGVELSDARLWVEVEK